MKNSYTITIKACFVGFIIQAIINNFIPLLFLTFQDTYGISLSKISMLVGINFLVQIVIDLLSANFIEKIGYRISAIIAHAFSCVGLILLAFLPDLLSDSFLGILICVVIYAIGGGLLEVLLSPIVEACPTDNKEAAMSLLHSFYCWGHVAVVIISTLFFNLFGINNWQILACIWAIVPMINTIIFAIVPITTLDANNDSKINVTSLLHKRTFWLFMVMMLCSGACEQSVSQWASAFAEEGLSVSKTIGDLAGPMMFAIMMGISRTIFGRYSEKLHLDKYIVFCSFLCITSYLMISLIPSPFLAFLGCAICGFSVGIMWPGTFSIAAKKLKGGGTAMFAFFALAGDIGCASGPSLVGLASAYLKNNLKLGILVAIVFPILMLFFSYLNLNNKKNNSLL